MPKNKRIRVELRYYEVPQNECVLALLGQRWKRNYGNDVEFLHFHNLMEIGICHQGIGLLEFEDGSRVNYRPGTITFLPCNVPHHTSSGGFDATDFWEYLFFDVEELLREFGPRDALYCKALAQRVNRSSRVLQQRECPAAEDILHAIFREMRSETREYRRQEVGCLLMALLMEVARLSPVVEHGYTRNGASVSQVGKALSYVQSHYAETLRIKTLADACGLSETHFRRLFDETVGMTPVEYLNLVRVQKACELLRTTQDSMETVAYKIGFTTQSSFNRNFLKLVGVSPMRWKNTEENYAVNPCRYHITAKQGWR